VSPVKYELGFYIPEDDILHSYCREILKSYMWEFAVEYKAEEQLKVLRYREFKRTCAHDFPTVNEFHVA
jgi:hypothetical protein